jgi:hypothetical protein
VKELRIARRPFPFSRRGAIARALARRNNAYGPAAVPAGKAKPAKTKEKLVFSPSRAHPHLMVERCVPACGRDARGFAKFLEKS